MLAIVILRDAPQARPSRDDLPQKRAAGGPGALSCAVCPQSHLPALNASLSRATRLHPAAQTGITRMTITKFTSGFARWCHELLAARARRYWA
jgi:hypothetical protein